MALDVVPGLQRLEPFSALDTTALQAIAALGEALEVHPGALVVQAGAVWDGLYVVTAGRVRLVNERTTGAPISIDTFQEGTYLGEHCFFAEVQAGFSVYGDAPETTLLRLSSARLATFLGQHAEMAHTFAVYGARRALEGFLASASTPVPLPVAQVVDLVQSLPTHTLQPGEFLTRAGDSADSLYIVLEGRFKVYRGPQPAAGVHVLQRGDVIGDLPSVTGPRLPGNAVAETLATVAVLPKAELLSLLLERQEFASSFDSLIPQAAPPPEAAAAPRETPAPAPADQAAPPPAEPEPVPPTQVTKLPWRYRFGRLPVVRQQSVMDCGAACLATVCRYHGKRVSLNRMRDLARVGTAGASMLDLMRAAITLGYDTEPYLATYDHLMEHALPAIVNWHGYHWIVVYQVTPTRVTVADPGEGVRTLSKAEFLEGWTQYTLYMQPTEALAALEESPPTLRQFIPYARPYKRVLYEILLASLGIQLFSLLLPLFTKFVIDEVIIKQRVQWFVPGLVVLSGVLVLHTVLSYCRQRLLVLVSLKTMAQMVSDFYTRLLSLPLSFFERRKVGDITSRFEENEKVTNFLTHIGLQSFLDLFTAVMYVGLMAYLNLRLTLVACAFVTLHIMIVQYVTPYLQHAYRDVFQKGADCQSLLIESLSGLRTLKTLGVEHLTRWHWEDLNIRFANADFQSIKFGSMSNLASGLVNNLSDVAVLFYGASMVLRGQLTVGELVAFTVLTQGLSGPLMKLVGLWDVFQETLTAVERLNDVLETAPEVSVEAAQDTIPLPPLRG